MKAQGIGVFIGVSLWASSVAFGAGFSATLGGLGQDYASAVALDGTGNTYVAGLTYSKDFPVTSGAVQTTFGGTCDAFVAKLGPNGAVIWATFLGGILDDGATGIALDPAGNVIVSGWTRSSDFPTVNAVQSVLNGVASNDNFDAFVAKLDPSGTKLLYSTFLGGPDADFGYGLAIDQAGAAYVAGTVSNSTKPGIFVTKLDPRGAIAYSYFHPSGSAAAIAVDAAGSAYVTGVVPPAGIGLFGAGSELGQAVVLKMSPDGSRVVYERTLGGGGGANGNAIAVAADGSAVVGGVTAAVDFPLVHPLQTDLGARPFWKSTDSAATFTAVAHVPFAFPVSLVSAPDGLYLATADAGIAKSTDGGSDWTLVNNGIASKKATAVAADPQHPGTLFAAAGSSPGAVYKTTDGGAHWTAVDSRATAGVTTLLVDHQQPQNVYAEWSDFIFRRSTDGGASWINGGNPGGSLAYFTADPGTTGSLWGYSQFIYGGSFGTGTPPYLWHSTDAGATWNRLTSPAPVLSGPIVFDPSAKPSTIYIGVSFRSDDGGATWVTLPQSIPASNLGPMAIGPGGVLYATSYNNGIFVSHDRGMTWTLAGSPVFQPAALFTSGDPSTVYALASNRQTTGFVTKLTPDGAGIQFSTFLGGTISFAPQSIFLAEPDGATWQNGVAGVALDSDGNVVVAGATRAADFPLTGGATCKNTGNADAFLVTIAADGSALLRMECLGGTQDDGALAVAVNPRAGAVAVGQTWSWDLATSPGLPPFVGFGDALVWRIAPDWSVQRRPPHRP